MHTWRRGGARAAVERMSLGGSGCGSGDHVLRSLRSMSFGERRTSVAVTGRGSPSDRSCCAAAGFDAHWPKPADRDMRRRRLAARSSAARIV